MAIATVLGAAALVGGLGLTISSAWLITMAAQHPPILALSVSIVMVRFFGISRSIARYAERIVSHESVFRSLTAIRVKLFEHMADRTSLNVRDLNSGNYAKAVVDDVERAQEYELRVTLPGSAALITMSAATLLAFWLQPLIGVLWLIVTILMSILIPRLAVSQMVGGAKAIESLESLYANKVRNSVHGALEAEIYGYLDEVLEDVKSIEKEINQEERALLKVIRSYQLAINLVMTAALILTFLYSNSHSLPPVQVSMLVFLALTGFEAILAWYPNLFTSGKLQLAKENLENIPESKSVNKQIVTFDSLVATNYSAYWSEPTIAPQNFQLKRGEVLVLRGASGVGKTTSAMGILDLVRYSGSLTINGIEVRDIENLSELAVGALQNGHIFNTSLRENLKISGAEDFDEVIKLLELDQLVSELPEGLDTIIGEFGRGISGGEAKRIILARALLSSAPLLVLDEPTEHLDPALAERITGRILDKYRDRALLVITHSGWSGVPQLHLVDRQ